MAQDQKKIFVDSLKSELQRGGGGAGGRGVEGGAGHRQQAGSRQQGGSREGQSVAQDQKNIFVVSLRGRKQRSPGVDPRERRRRGAGSGREEKEGEGA